MIAYPQLKLRKQNDFVSIYVKLIHYCISTQVHTDFQSSRQACRSGADSEGQYQM